MYKIQKYEYEIFPCILKQLFCPFNTLLVHISIFKNGKMPKINIENDFASSRKIKNLENK